MRMAGEGSFFFATLAAVQLERVFEVREPNYEGGSAQH